MSTGTGLAFIGVSIAVVGTAAFAGVSAIAVATIGFFAIVMVSIL